MCSYSVGGGRQDHGCEQGMYHGGVAPGVWILPIGLETIGLSGGCVVVSFEWVRVVVWCIYIYIYIYIYIIEKRSKYIGMAN